MTATEELRRLLDECGFEHDDEFVKSGIPYCDGYEATYWGGDSFGYVEPIGAPPGTIGSYPELTISNCAPEQAIAATLGRGTCKLSRGTSGLMHVTTGHCSECGAEVVKGTKDGYRSRYCQWCGAKVVGE